MRPALMATAVCLLALTACSKPDAPKATEAQGTAPAGPRLDDWSYSGDNGPEHWARLGGDSVTCGQGKRQSPIDLTGFPPAKVADLTLDYLSSTATIQNTGRFIQVSPSNGGALVMDKTSYKLKSFHFRTPSEHIINGHRAALETQFVHENDKGQTLIVSVMSDIGVADPMLAPIWTFLPTDPGAPVAIPDVLLNARDLMPATEEFYAYSGSLTAPPCTEEVTWLVAASPLSISPEQIDTYQRLIGANARPAQARNGRDLLHIIGG